MSTNKVSYDGLAQLISARCADSGAEIAPPLAYSATSGVGEALKAVTASEELIAHAEKFVTGLAIG